MVLMPQMGVSEESAVLANWMVKEGDAVKVDQVLFVLETGKSTFECKSEHNGFVLKLFANEGDEVNVGVAVCAIGAQGEKVDAPAAAAPAAAEAAPAAVEAAPAAPAAAPAALPAGVNMVLMPQMGVSEESAVLANWMVKEGDEVKVDQVLFVLETGKSTFECKSEHNGFVLKLFANEGDEVNVGVAVCAVGPHGVKIDAPAPAAAAPVEAAPVAAAPVAAPAPAAAPKATAAMGEGKASPRAKNLAAEMGVNVFAATPTGPNGRIIERDVRTLMESGIVEVAATPVAEAAPAAKAEAAPGAAAAAYEDKPLSKIRKVIAENMHKSLSEMAQLTLNRTFDATAMIELRKKFKNSKGYGLENVTLNDFILFAVSRTLLEFPELNAYFMGDKMRCFNNVNLAVAVDTPRGLMVPVIPAMEKLNIGTISNLVKEKAAQCKDGSINPAELSGGSFTVTNLGSMGIESFTPVINLPQTAILGVGTFQLKPRENADGEIEFYQAMGLSLTFDHRAVDGSPAAKFLKVLAERLENIELTLAL